MNRLLIDSHVLIWALYEPKRFGTQAKHALKNASVVNVSLAGIWELALKHQKGKLAYGPEELLDGVDALGAELLDIQSSHILVLQRVTMPHKDPFDQLLLAQAEAEYLTLLTADEQLLCIGLPNVVDVRK
jgi:PIN domain nuclease of toxin-antitoxin system